MTAASTAQPHAADLRPFIPAKDYALSKRFYQDIGFPNVNGQPGALVSDAAGKLFTVLAFDIDASGHIAALRSIVSPDKLRHVGQQAS